MKTKRELRKKQTAEIFTPPELVNDMLDKLNEYGPESFEECKTFVDPSCGNGNMLIEVLKRKLSLKHKPLKAVQTIYGTDIMQDNVEECRERLINILKDNNVTITQEIKNIIKNNIVWVPNGSLDYDFSFNNNIWN